MRIFIRTLVLIPVIFSQIICESSPVFLGIYIGFKEGVNAVNTPDGRRNGFSFSSVPDVGIKIEYPLKLNLPISLYSELSYSNYSFIIKESKSSDVIKSFKHRISYITFTPGIIFDIINVGFSFGLPLSANYGPEIDLSHINTLVEVKAGANINLYQDELGVLKFNIQAGYMLSGIFSDYGTQDPLLEILPPKKPQTITDEFNPRVVSLMVGLTFLLNPNNIF